MSGKNYHVHFGTMHCMGTEDAVGDDEIVIKRYEDDVYKAPSLLWNDATAEDYKHFDAYGNFNSRYRIDVTESDNPPIDSDDSIGSVTIDSSNINDEFVRLDPWGRGDYSLTWTHLTHHHTELKNTRSGKTSNQPSHSAMSGYGSNVDPDKARQGHQALKNHMSQGTRNQQTHKAVLKAVHTFKKTTDSSERSSVVQELKNAIDFNPVRGIIKQIHDGKWPTVVLYGPTAAVDFGFASFNMAYGIALQLDGSRAGSVLAFGADIGLTSGDEGKIGIGLNRNEIENVPGYTYAYTVPADAELTGGITSSFDSALEAPNLQELTYTWSPLPAGVSIGYEYTVGLGNFS